MLLWVVAAVSLCSICGAVDEDVTFVVEARESFCIFDDFNLQTTIELQFEVEQGGQRDISLVVRDPRNRILVNKRKLTKGDATFAVDQPGEYQICFDNSFSRLQSKTVWLNYYDDRPMSDYDADYSALPEPTVSLEVAWEEIFDAIHTLRMRVSRTRMIQTVRKNSENRDQKLVESNASIVTNASVVTIILILITGVVQVHVVKSFFSQPSKSRSKGSSW